MTGPFCEAERVFLRQVQLSDASLILKWKRDPLLREMALDADSKVSLKSERDDIRRAIRSDDQLYLIVVVKQLKQPIGYFRIDWLDKRHHCAWLRFALGEQRGQGYAKEALKCLLARLFAEGVHRVEAEVYSHNEVSLALLERLGFQREGLKREAHFDGKTFLDVIVLGLLHVDYESRVEKEEP